MIDLKEIEKEIDELLESETSDSLLAWLKGKEDAELVRYMGAGTYFPFPGMDIKCIMPVLKRVAHPKNNEDKVSEHTNYAFAA